MRVIDFNIYVLLDPGANLSFVTLYLSIRFDITPKILLEPFSVYIPIGDSILAKKVYKGCPTSVFYKVILCDLIELVIIDFDVILDIDWLHSSYTSIDYRTHRDKFQFS